MQITEDVRVTGSFESSIKLALRFTQDEIDSVFAANNDALFANIFSPRWDDLPESEKLRQLMELQVWLEGRAVDLGLEGGEVVAKE
jgi:hypothetical protein